MPVSCAKSPSITLSPAKKHWMQHNWRRRWFALYYNRIEYFTEESTASRRRRTSFKAKGRVFLDSTMRLTVTSRSPSRMTLT